MGKRTSLKVSVVAPSFKRPVALMELLGRLQRQNYDDFEIIVVEHSQDEEIVKKIEKLGDNRIKVITGAPTGLPAARNIGVRASSGDVLLFIDDDDLPINENWIATHAANYADPNCMGVCGRQCPKDEIAPPPPNPEEVYNKAFTLTFYKDVYLYAKCDKRKIGIRFLTFNNGSLRRCVFERAGGFDEGVPFGEEMPIFFKFEKIKKPWEYFVFDPSAPIWRRMALDGGLNRRYEARWYLKEFRNRVIYFHKVVAHYYPRRFWTLYPLFLLRILVMMWECLWDGDNAAFAPWKKFLAFFVVVMLLPIYVFKYGLSSGSAVRRVEAVLPSAS